MYKSMLHLPAQRRRQLMRAAVMGSLGLWMVQPANAAATPAEDDAIASAYYGKSEIWLRHKPDDRSLRELVFKPTPDAEPHVVDVIVPQRDRQLPSEWTENLALGLDRAGKVTVVMQSKRGLYWTHVRDQPRLHRVPRTTKDDAFPSLFRGKLACVHAVGTRSSARLGSLTGGPASTVWSNRSDDNLGARHTAIGAGNTVAFVTVSDGAEDGLYDAQLARRGRSRLLDLWPGDRHNGGLSLAVSRNGRRLTVASSRTVLRYALPSGSKLARKR